MINRRIDIWKGLKYDGKAKDEAEAKADSDNDNDGDDRDFRPIMGNIYIGW